MPYNAHKISIPLSLAQLDLHHACTHTVWKSEPLSYSLFKAIVLPIHVLPATHRRKPAYSYKGPVLRYQVALQAYLTQCALGSHAIICRCGAAQRACTPVYGASLSPHTGPLLVLSCALSFLHCKIQLKSALKTAHLSGMLW